MRKSLVCHYANNNYPFIQPDQYHLFWNLDTALYMQNTTYYCTLVSCLDFVQ